MNQLKKDHEEALANHKGALEESAAAKLMDAEKSWKAKHAEESKKMSEAHEDALSKHRGVLEELQLQIWQQLRKLLTRRMPKK